MASPDFADIVAGDRPPNLLPAAGKYPAGREEDEEGQAEKKGTKKKGPAKKISRREREYRRRVAKL